MKKRIVIIAYVSIMVFAALMLSPQKSNADVLAYEAVESMEKRNMV